jgi:four helix bundle protein
MYNESAMSQVVNAPLDLRDRTLDFARQVIRFTKGISQSTQSSPIIHQLIRSSSSIGANFIEAKNASSKRDFLNKVFISKKEASETLYWLKLSEELTNSPALLKLQEECREIILILQKIITTLKN